MYLKPTRLCHHHHKMHMLLCVLSESFIRWGWAQRQGTAVCPNFVQHMGSVLPEQDYLHANEEDKNLHYIRMITKRVREPNRCEQKSVLEGCSHGLSITCLVTPPGINIYSFLHTSDSHYHPHSSEVIKLAFLWRRFISFSEHWPQYFT